LDNLGYAVIQILVTGGTGYLGRHIVSLSKRLGLEAFSVGRSADADVSCDLRDRQQCMELVGQFPTAAIIHCAAVVPADRDGYSDQAAADDSILMVENLVAAGPPHMVFTSSMTVYPNGIGVAREADAEVTGNGYAAAKLAGERILLDHSGFSTIMLRLPGLFGSPRKDGLLFNVARRLVRGEPPQLSENLPQWAGLHIEDAAEICVRAAMNPMRETLVLNAGYPDAMSIPNVMSKLAKIFGTELAVPEVSTFTFDLSHLVSKLGPISGNFQNRLEEFSNWVRHEVRAEGND